MKYLAFTTVFATVAALLAISSPSASAAPLTSLLASRSLGNSYNHGEDYNGDDYHYGDDYKDEHYKGSYKKEVHKKYNKHKDYKKPRHYVEVVYEVVKEKIVTYETKKIEIHEDKCIKFEHPDNYRVHEIRGWHEGHYNSHRGGKRYRYDYGAYNNDGCDGKKVVKVKKEKVTVKKEIVVKSVRVHEVEY